MSEPERSGILSTTTDTIIKSDQQTIKNMTRTVKPSHSQHDPVLRDTALLIGQPCRKTPEISGNEVVTTVNKQLSAK